MDLVSLMSKDFSAQLWRFFVTQWKVNDVQEVGFPPSFFPFSVASVLVVGALFS